MKRMLMIAFAVALLPAAASAQEQGPDLAGLWRFDMISPKGATTLGAMTVMRNKSSGAYEGKLITNGGIHGLPIRSLRLQSRLGRGRDRCFLRIAVEGEDSAGDEQNNGGNAGKPTGHMPSKLQGDPARS